MLTKEQKIQFNEILEELGNTLDVSETQYEAAVKSYQAVGNWLSKEDSSLAPYKPEILPQGSFMLGTMIKPICDKDDLDIDLVCQLTGKHPDWTQCDLKNKVGDRLKAHSTYKDMLDEEGRRCWTLLYREDSEKISERYHMDILPSIVSDNYSIILEKSLSASEIEDAGKLAIRITCTDEENYYEEEDPEFWLKSNPFGYGKWFLNKASLALYKSFSLNESIAPVPKYQKEKLPLQRVVQILKRHRDMMFNGHKHKPISIIITTLAAKAYEKETDVINALINIVDRMPDFIEERYSEKHGKVIKWITNPVDEEENFADRWVNEPKREENFYKWMKQVKLDLQNASIQRGTQNLMESLSKAFGEAEIQKTFSNIGNRAKELTKQGANRFDTKVGIIAGAANAIKPHNFYGAED
jgi:hypothetical protein